MKIITKAFLILVTAVAASIFYLFYSIHSSYYQGVRSKESYKHAKTVTASLSKYHSMHFKYPKSIDELNLEKPEQNYIGKITFDNQTGVIEIQLAGDSLSEGVLIFSPQTRKNNKISYICQSMNVPTEYIPEECAPQEINYNSSPQPITYDVDWASPPVIKA